MFENIIDKKSIRKVGCDFSTTKEALNEILNLQFRNNVNAQNLSATNSNTYIYQTLSAVSDEIGSILYDGILNYIDDVSNIELCKVKALQSQISYFGTHYNIFDNITDIPEDLEKIIDVMSIQREYLFNSQKINSVFVDILKKYVCEPNSTALTGQTTIVGKNDTVVNVSADNQIVATSFYSLLSSLYYEHLTANLLDVYYDNSKMDRILDVSSVYDTYIENGHKLIVHDAETQSTIDDLKQQYNIQATFDESKIVDEIDKGNTQLEDYSSYEQEILKCEIKFRQKPYYSTSLQSRNYYYRMQHVQKYVDFIEKQTYDLNASIKNSDVYSIDDKLIEINKSTTTENLLVREKNLISLNYSMIHKVAELLTDLTIKIQEIRTSIRSQVQKINMKGTRQLIEYTIYEYLRDNILPLVKTYSNNPLCIDLNSTSLNIDEYVDPVEYFNISTQYDSSSGISGANQRYWETQSSISAMVPSDSTNIFRVPDTRAAFNAAFTSVDVENLYFNTLQMKNEGFVNDGTMSKSEHLDKFLNSVFDSAADATYVDSDGNINAVSSDSKYKTDLVNVYGNMKHSSYPHLNYKNVSHPSYQVHPYVRSFIETVEYYYPIDNLTTLIASTMFEMLKANIDSYIDDSGYLLNVWNNPLNRNSEYLSRYESSSHRDETGKDNPTFCYDGFLYPPAESDLNLCVTADFATQIKINKNQWYNGLNLTTNEIDYICSQLSAYRNNIEEISRDSYYDIYRYAVDIYGNSYILLKTYSDCVNYTQLSTISEQIKLDAPGQLWIRMKNHPFAFPAYDLNGTTQKDTAQLHIENGVTNDKLTKVDKISGTNFPIVYDFFIDDSRSQIEIYTKVNNQKYIVVADIKKTFNTTKDVNRHLLQFNALGVDNTFDGIEVPTGYTFRKFTMFNDSSGVIFSKVSENNIYFEIDSFYYQVNSNSKLASSSIRSTVNGTMTITDANSLDNTFKFDFNNNVITVYYINKNKIDGKYFSNFLSISDKYVETNFNNANVSLITTPLCKKMLYVTKKGMYTYGSQRYYAPYVDIGFYPITDTFTDGNTLTNDFSDTAIMDRFNQTNVLKLQLLSKPGTGKGIDFLQNIPIRTYEQYDVDATSITKTPSGRDVKNIEAIRYRHAHFFEDSHPLDLGDDNPYNPTELYQTLAEVNDEDVFLHVKVDEEYTSFFSEIPKDNQFLKYDTDSLSPWLLCYDKASYPEYLTPGTDNKWESSIDNLITVNIDGIDDNSYPLKIRWMKVGEKIKIDINPEWYNKKISTPDNYFNYQHTFLSLDEPGTAGFLKVYKKNVDLKTMFDFYDSTKIYAVLLIKNVSDTKPKLLIVKDWPNYNLNRRY